MDPAYVSAIAALAGTLVGGLTSFATSWISLRYQGRRELASKDIVKRETLYTEFINEATRLMVDAMGRELEDTAGMAPIISLIARIRLNASEPVLHAAEDLAKTIFKMYFSPNLTVRQLHEMRQEVQDASGPMDAFSDACRDELQKLQRSL